MDFVSDFDQMLARKKAEMKINRRKKRGADLISDADDIIMAMIARMKEIANVSVIPNAIDVNLRREGGEGWGELGWEGEGRYILPGKKAKVENLIHDADDII